MATRKNPQSDDFDGILLENYVPPTGPQELHVCWSCQKQFLVDRLVCLGGDCVLPVCTHCWDQMPVADRLKTAKALSVFAEENESRQHTRKLVDFVLEFMKEAKREHDEGKRDDGDQFSWLTGRRN